ncbi:MAG: TAXI family TRAP transporter solute-binding subunit [Rhodospirillales bacterium]|nr:TAXI family TRAP transporter solute-binding subunit [Rhodospirillales bacterium]
MRKFVFYTSLAVAVVFSASAMAQTVGIAASKKGSLYDRSATVLAKIVTNKGGMNATVRNFASPNVYLPGIDKGQVDFGLANRYEFGLAVEGKEHFKGRPMGNLRVVSIMYPLRVAFFVKKDSPIQSIADLKGKTMPAGYVAHKIIHKLMVTLMATEGMSPKDFGKQVPVPNVVAGANAFISGKSDGFFFALSAPKVREANAKHGIRAIDVANTPANLAAIRKHIPIAYFRKEMPHKGNPGVTKPIHAMAYDALVFTHKGVSDDSVYKMAKAMHDNLKDLGKAFPPFRLLKANGMAKNLGSSKYHPGAIKFYKEKGLWPPK